MRIAVLGENIPLAACLRANIPSRCPPVLLRSLSWDALFSLAQSGRCDFALLDICRAPGARQQVSPVADLLRLAGILGRDRMILVLPKPCRGLDLQRELGAAGFRYLLLPDVDDCEARVMRSLARAELRRVVDAAFASQIAGAFPGPDLQLMLDILTTWPPVRRVAALANDLRIARRTLERRLETARFPEPRRCLAWSVLLETAMLRRWGAGSQEKIAGVVDIAGGSDLSHRWGRLAGEPPSKAGEIDPVDRSLNLLLKDLREGRKGA